MRVGLKTMTMRLGRTIVDLRPSSMKMYQRFCLVAMSLNLWDILDHFYIQRQISIHPCPITTIYTDAARSTDLISLRERNGDRRYDIAEDTLDTEQQAGADREAVDALTDTSTSNHQKIDSEDNRGLPAYDMFEDHLERNPWQDEPVQKQHLLSEIIAVEATPDDPSSVDNDNTLPNGDVEPIADNTTDTAEQPPVTENDKVMAETSRMGDSATDEHPEGHLPLLDLVDLEPAASKFPNSYLSSCKFNPRRLAIPIRHARRLPEPIRSRQCPVTALGMQRMRTNDATRES